MFRFKHWRLDRLNANRKEKKNKMKELELFMAAIAINNIKGEKHEL